MVLRTCCTWCLDFSQFVFKTKVPQIGSGRQPGDHTFLSLTLVHTHTHTQTQTGDTGKREYQTCREACGNKPLGMGRLLEPKALTILKGGSPKSKDSPPRLLWYSKVPYFPPTDLRSPTYPLPCLLTYLAYLPSPHPRS